MERAALGSCVGFGISSALPFRTLRSGYGPALLVDLRSGPEPRGEEIVTWRPRTLNAFHGRLLRLDHRYAFWASDAGWFVIDPSVPSISVDDVAEDEEASLIRELRLFGVPASICAMERGDVAIHASAVEIDGQAVLFAGPSMHGKTTLAAAFTARGHRLLSEDTARCAVSMEPVIHPGPAVVRLRSDVADHMRVPHATGLPAPDGRVPLIFDTDRRGTGAPVPLGAIVLLRSDDEVNLTPVSAHEAARDLFALSFRLPLAEHRSATFARVVDLAARVPVLNLYRPMTLESIDEVITRIGDHLARP